MVDIIPVAHSKYKNILFAVSSNDKEFTFYVLTPDGVVQYERTIHNPMALIEMWAAVTICRRMLEIYQQKGGAIQEMFPTISKRLDGGPGHSLGFEIRPKPKLALSAKRSQYSPSNIPKSENLDLAEDLLEDTEDELSKPCYLIQSYFHFPKQTQIRFFMNLNSCQILDTVLKNHLAQFLSQFPWVDTIGDVVKITAAKEGVILGVEPGQTTSPMKAEAYKSSRLCLPAGYRLAGMSHFLSRTLIPFQENLNDFIIGSNNTGLKITRHYDLRYQAEITHGQIRLNFILDFRLIAILLLACEVSLQKISHPPSLPIDSTNWHIFEAFAKQQNISVIQFLQSTLANFAQDLRQRVVNVPEIPKGLRQEGDLQLPLIPLVEMPD